jgi:hypothetical protein
MQEEVPLGHDIALDCGSGGTRIYQRKASGGGIQRLKWPGPLQAEQGEPSREGSLYGGKAPVLSQCLGSTTGNAAFANPLRSLPSPPFIGATAGLRHSIDTGKLSWADVDALRCLLPPGSALSVLSPLQEARFELRALRRHHPDCDCAMVSMGGKSMQLGREATLCSLPFAMHLGYGLLQEKGGGNEDDGRGQQGSWPQLVDFVSTSYQQRAAEAVERQRLTPLDGAVVGVTDCVDLARELGLLDRPPIGVARLLDVLDACVTRFANRQGGRSGLVKSEIVLLARAMALAAAARYLFAPSATVTFPSGFAVSWTEGYFLESDDAAKR